MPLSDEVRYLLRNVITTSVKHIVNIGGKVGMVYPSLARISFYAHFSLYLILKAVQTRIQSTAQTELHGTLKLKKPHFVSTATK